MSLPGLALPNSCPSPLTGEEIHFVGYDLTTATLPDYLKAGTCRQLSEFKNINNIKTGNSGVFYKVQDLKKNEIVTLKKLKTSLEDFSLTWIMEINILNILSHENVIELKEVIAGKSLDKIYLALEYCSYSLAEIPLSEQKKFMPSQVKNIMFQLFHGLEYIHQKGVIHRNIKSSNILFNDKGILKIGGFTVATVASNINKLPLDITKFEYKAPELIFKMKSSFPADIWAAGCIFAELLRGKPLFSGTNDGELVNLLIACLGTPNNNIWPDLDANLIMWFERLSIQPYNKLKFYFPDCSPQCILLLQKLFLYNPDRRITATQCLNHDYFKEDPLMCLNEDLAQALHYFMTNNSRNLGEI